MTRSVLMMDLKDDPVAIKTYVEYHEHVWPEVVRSLRNAGIEEMEIYLLGRRLVMIVDTADGDVKGCFAAHKASHPRVIEWEGLMKSLQQPPPGAPPGEWWAEMRQVFVLPRAVRT